MTYDAALYWRNEHLDLIGTKDNKGFVVSELLIVPSNPKDRDMFLKNYFFSEQNESAILPYVSDGVQVWSIDLGQLKSNNILFYKVLAE